MQALKKYAVFSGRASRKEYWMFFLFSIVFAVAFLFVDGIITSAIKNDAAIFVFLYCLAMLIPGIAVSVRRMHDINKSGWYILIPVYNILLALTKGTKGGSKFGPDPKEKISVDQKVNQVEPTLLLRVQQSVNVPATLPPSGKKSKKMPIWFTITATLLTLGLIFLWGSSMNGHQFPRKTLEVLYSYPLFAIVAIVLIWVKRRLMWAISPFIVLLFLMIIFSIVAIRNDGQSRHLNMQTDKNLISHNLDDVADIKVPQSFSLHESSSQENSRRFLDSTKGNAMYYFYLDRATFSKSSGEGPVRPVKLTLAVYNPLAKVENLAVNINRVDSGLPDELPERKLYDTETLQKDPDSSLVRTKFTTAWQSGKHAFTSTALIYTNNKYHYRLTLNYWDESYLTNDAARELLEKVIPTIVIKDSLDFKAEGIMDILQEKYPKVSQEKPEDLKALVKKMITKAESYGLKTEEGVMGYATSAWLLGESFDTDFPAVAQKLDDKALSSAEKAKWLEEWTTELLKTPEMKIIQATAEKMAVAAVKKSHKTIDLTVAGGTRLANDIWEVFVLDKSTSKDLDYRNYWVKVGATEGGKVIKITPLRLTKLGEDFFLGIDSFLVLDEGVIFEGGLMVAMNDAPSARADSSGLIYFVKLEVADAEESSTLEFVFRRTDDGAAINWRGYSIQVISANVYALDATLVVNKLGN